MAALEATIRVRGPNGERSISDCGLLPPSCPGNTPQRETVLEPGDLITQSRFPTLAGKPLSSI